MMMNALADARSMDFILYLPRFEGPLDLLLYLIEKNKFTLADLQICPIIDQYMAYVARMRALDIELAGEFLDMASYLIWLKSCLLLPSLSGPGEEGVSPEHELKEMLKAYLAIKQAAHELSERPMLYRDRFPRGSTEPERSMPRMGLAALLKAIEAIRDRTKHYIMRLDETRRFSIREMMGRIHALLKSRPKIDLKDCAKTGEKTELIALFMAALELSKSSIARLVQHGLFGRIILIRKEA
jgi:segregation and condensation protein A